MKIEPQAKCSRSHPPSVGPMTTPRPATDDHRAMALARSAGTVKTLVKMERVAGMTAAAPIPITTRQATSSLAEVAMAATVEPRPEDNQAAGQGPVPSDAVTQAAQREQQPGHGQGVGVDDPLQCGRRGVEVAHQGGKRHVDDGAVHHHDQKGQAEYAEGGPAPGVYLFEGQGSS